MEIRKEIESLAIWYIPGFIVAFIASSILSGSAREIIDFGEVTPATEIVLTTSIISLAGLIDNAVVAIWLYIQGKKEKGRPILWFLFGLVAHFYAALIYIGLRIYEEQKAHNKRLWRQPPE